MELKMKTAANSYTQKTQFLILKEQFLFFHLLQKLFEAGIFEKIYAYRIWIYRQTTVDRG